MPCPIFRILTRMCAGPESEVYRRLRLGDALLLQPSDPTATQPTTPYANSGGSRTQRGLWFAKPQAWVCYVTRYSSSSCFDFHCGRQPISSRRELSAAWIQPDASRPMQDKFAGERMNACEERVLTARRRVAAVVNRRWQESAGQGGGSCCSILRSSLSLLMREAFL